MYRKRIIDKQNGIRKKVRKVVKTKEFSRSFENEYVREYICSVHHGIIWIIAFDLQIRLE